MDKDFILQCLEIVVWPLTFGVVILSFWRPIAERIRRIKKIGHRDSEVAFDNGDEGKLQSSSEPLSIDKYEESIDERQELPTKSDNLFDVIRLIKDESVKAAEAAMNEYLKKIDDKEDARILEAFFWSQVFMSERKIEIIDKIERIYTQSQSEKARADVLTSQAYCYSVQYGPQKSLDFLDDYVKNFTEDYARAILAQAYSGYLLELERPQDAIAYLERVYSGLSDNKSLSLVLRSLSVAEDRIGKTEMAALCKEKAIQLAPHDNYERFQTAYKQSNSRFKLLSIVNYEDFLSIAGDDSMAWNNLGVNARDLKFNFKAVKFFNNAKNLQNSLACSNISSMLLEAGFTEMAKDVAEEGLKLPEKNIRNHEVLTDIDSKESSESEEWKNLLKLGRKIKTHVGLYVQAYYANSAHGFAGRWKDNTGKLFHVTVTHNVLEGECEVEEAKGLMMPLGPGSIEKRKHTIVGDIVKSTAEVEYRIQNKEDTILGFSKKKHENLRSYLSADGNTWFIFSLSYRDKFEMTLERIDEGE